MRSPLWSSELGVLRGDWYGMEWNGHGRRYLPAVFGSQPSVPVLIILPFFLAAVASWLSATKPFGGGGLAHSHSGKHGR